MVEGKFWGSTVGPFELGRYLGDNFISFPAEMNCLNT
jgi:hypothetical protein